MKQALFLIALLLAFAPSCAYYDPQEHPMPSHIWDKNGLTLTKAIGILYNDIITFKDGRCHFYETQNNGKEIEYEIEKCHIMHSLQKVSRRTNRQDGIEVKGLFWIEGNTFRTRPQDGEWGGWKSSKNLRGKSWQQRTGYNFKKRNDDFDFSPTIGVSRIHKKSNSVKNNTFKASKNKDGTGPWVIVIPFIPFILFFLLLVYRGESIGVRGEKYTMKRIKKITNGYVFRDVYINGSHDVQQIDIIAVTEKGVLVVEKKTYSGLVVGKAHDRLWRVYYRGRQMYVMQNPHHQNYGHIQALCEKFPTLKGKFINLVIFGNNAVLGDNIPLGTFYDNDIEFVYKCLPTILNAEEMEIIARDIAALNNDKPLLKRIHKGKIRRLYGGW